MDIPFTKNFAFINVNENRGAVVQKEVRAHAMRESIRKKRSGVTTTTRGPEPIPYQTGRFRLHTLPTDTILIPLPKTKLKSLGKSQKKKQTKRVRVSPHEKLAGESTTQQTANETEVVKGALSFGPSEGRLDPFDVLPVKLGLPQQKLLYYYDNSIAKNDVAYISNTHMLSLASSDPAWFHANFAIHALSNDLRKGTVWRPSGATLFHRGEALRIVKQRLAKDPDNVADSTIGAVATLANHEIMSGSLSTAKAHIDGLEQLLRSRGGIRALPEKADFLRNLIVLSDIAFALVWGGKPLFQSFEDATLSSTYSNVIQDEFVKAQKLKSYLCRALRKVKIVCNTESNKTATENTQQSFSLDIYKVQYRLATLIGAVDDMTASTFGYSFEHQANDLAKRLYPYLAFRDIPEDAKIPKIMVKDLKELLELGGQMMVILWSEPTILLWILFVGGATALNRPERSYLVQNLVVAAIALNVTSLVEFEGVLKLAAWTDDFCGPFIEALWREMEIWRIETGILPGTETDIEAKIRHGQKERALIPSC